MPTSSQNSNGDPSARVERKVSSTDEDENLEYGRGVMSCISPTNADHHTRLLVHLYSGRMPFKSMHDVSSNAVAKIRVCMSVSVYVCVCVCVYGKVCPPPTRSHSLGSRSWTAGAGSAKDRRIFRRCSTDVRRRFASLVC